MQTNITIKDTKNTLRKSTKLVDYLKRFSEKDYKSLKVTDEQTVKMPFKSKEECKDKESIQLSSTSDGKMTKTQRNITHNQPFPSR